MHRALLWLTSSFVGSLLVGCAAWVGAPVAAGQSEAEVLRRLGTPTNRYAEGSDTLLEYRGGPMGQTTHMARIGPDGALRSYEQVLTLEQFGRIETGKARKDDVLRRVGSPSQVRHFRLVGLEGWDYPFKESGVWDSLMTVYFDQSGVVRRIESGLDPRRMARD